MKQYTFTEKELLVLREALTEYKHFLLEDEGGVVRSDGFYDNFNTCEALREQIKTDIRLGKG